MRIGKIRPEDEMQDVQVILNSLLTKYSWFCQSYEKWHGAIDPVMRQNYRAGEKLFVDYAGQTAGVIYSDR